MTEQDSSSTPSTDSTGSLWQSLNPLLSDTDRISVVPEHTQAYHDPPQVRQALNVSRASQQRCMVPGCMRASCKLGTHLRYVPRSTQLRTAPRQQTKHGSLALKQLQTYNSQVPPVDGVDGFPSLPIHDILDPQVRSLFHFFFTDMFDRIALLFRGPSVVDMAEFKERMLAAAMKSEVYCRSLILQAHTEQQLSARHEEETKHTLSLVDNVLTAFRGQLDLIRQTRHPLYIELALLVLVVLMHHDSAHDRKEALQVHWKGLRDLVAMRGGIHCVTMSLAYVMHADRSCAARFDVMPTFTSTVSRSIPLHIPSLTSSRYGSRFQAMKFGLTTVHPDIVTFLEDTSGLVGLWEENYAESTDHDKSRGPRLSFEHLYYLRDRIDERFAVLNAQWARIDSVERFLLWAARLIEYPCTWANYVRPTSRDLSTKLTKSLRQKSEMINLWRSDLDVLMWILFVLITVEPLPDTQSWIVICLRSALNEMYGGTVWSQAWRLEVQERLRKCIWLKTRYTVQYENICDVLEQPTYHPAGVKNLVIGRPKLEHID